MALTSLDPTTVAQIRKLFTENDAGKSGKVKLAGGKAVVTLPAKFDSFRPFVQGIGLKNNPSLSSAVFSGSGLNDVTSGGSYSGFLRNFFLNATFTVQIDGEGTPDTFKWKKDSGDFTTGVAITGSAQELQDGVTVTFAATEDHTLNDQWTITVTVGAIAYSVDVREKNKFTIISADPNDTGEVFWFVLTEGAA